ncbi:CTP synthase [Artemisia annua]|uniref:CTP synthase n=1 Tax=Artemisia annua TaxID=35608 RepID=A0A2U1MCF9_ARTAN|nr:CTP synthase [Artemisia annua]
MFRIQHAFWLLVDLDRGVKGLILAANYARENKVPYFGIFLGMRISVSETAISVVKQLKQNECQQELNVYKKEKLFGLGHHNEELL